MPGHTLTVERVVSTLQTNLIAVIHAGSAGVSHLEKQRQTQGRLVFPHDSEGARWVVATQESELDGSDLWAILALQVADRLGKLFRTQRCDVLIGALADLFLIE